MGRLRMRGAPVGPEGKSNVCHNPFDFEGERGKECVIQILVPKDLF
jgi:hypothetical protein